MSLIRTVMTKYQADAGDHIAEAGKLKKAMVDAANSASESWGALDGVMERSKRVFGDVHALMSKLSEAQAEYVDKIGLLANASSANLGRLDKAAAGTKSTMDLLRQAAELQNGAFHASSEAIETAILAERELVRQGNDVEKVHAAITEALTKGTVDGLRPYGIAVDLAGASMSTADGRAKIFATTMDELKKLASDSGLAFRTHAEELQAASAKDANSLGSIKNSIGSIVDALGPLKTAASDVLGGLAELLDQVTDASRRQRHEAVQLAGQKAWEKKYADANNFERTEFDRKQFGGYIGWQTGYDPRVMASLGPGGAFDAADNARLMNAYGTDKAQEFAGRFTGKGKAPASAATAAKNSNVSATVRTLQDALSSFAFSVENENASVFGGAIGPRGGLGSAAGYGSVLGDDVTKALAGTINGRQTQNWKDELGNRRKARESMLESTFGKLDEFNKYSAAFNMLQSAVTGAMDAWITGSESMATAVKKAIGAGLKALAADLAIQALKHGAYAIGSLAFGDVRGASLHGVAAAQFAAGSVAAAVAARAMGHGGTDYGKASGTGGGGAGAASPVGRGPANSNAPAQSSIVYVVGDPYDTETNPRRRQNSAKKLVASVGRSSMGGAY